MLIHRRPEASTISTRGVAGSGANGTTAPRARAALRSRGLGSEGIGTERVVGQRHTGFASKDSVPLAIFPGHSWTHPEGWRDWPDETPATPVAVTDGKVPIPERCVAGFPRPHGGRHDTKGTPTWLLLSSPVANAAPTTRSRR